MNTVSKSWLPVNFHTDVYFCPFLFALFTTWKSFQSKERCQTHGRFCCTVNRVPHHKKQPESVLEGEDSFPQGFQGDTCICLNIRKIAAIITLFSCQMSSEDFGST